MQRNSFLLICIFSIIPFSIAYANPITLDEVTGYLKQNITIHDPGDSSIKIKPFDYPALDILPLWKRLDFKWKKEIKENDVGSVFGCKKDDKKCFIKEPKQEYLGRKDIKIIDITNRIPWDHQYLIFKNGVYLGHLEFTMQKYEDPTIVFLEDDLISIKILNETGSDIIGYLILIYQINDKHGVRRVLTYRDRYERSDWGVPYDITIGSKSSYRHGQFKVKYQIKIMQGLVPNINKKILDEPIVKDERTIIYKRTKEGFRYDSKRSKIKPDFIDSLDDSKFLYSKYKSKFDRLKGFDKEDQRWLKYFLKDTKQ